MISFLSSFQLCKIKLEQWNSKYFAQFQVSILTFIDYKISINVDLFQNYSKEFILFVNSRLEHIDVEDN